MTCFCDLTRDERLDTDDYECDTHVRCDQTCKALLDPVTHDETFRAMQHWRSHRSMGGCSHGC